MIKYEYYNNDYLLNNVYNWGKIYKGAGNRFTHMYSNYFKDGIWNFVQTNFCFWYGTIKTYKIV